MRLSVWFSALALPLLVVPSPAQHAVQYSSSNSAPAKPAPKDIIHAIVFHGETPYSQSSLEAVSGLHPGEAIHQSNLQAATDRLIDTGAFRDVQATLSGHAEATDVIFTLKPTDPSNFLHTSFENLIWWQPDELLTELQKQLPLFNGSIPEAGTQQDALQEALQKLLTAKHINATVSSELIAPYPNQPLRIAEYAIGPPLIRIHSLTLNGVSAPFTPLTTRLTQTLVNTPYNEGLTQSSVQSRLLDLYKDAGYQEASLTSLTRTASASNSTTIDVDVTATIHEGDPYRLSTLNWSGSQVMSSQAFNTAAKLHPGDLASQQLLQDSLNNLDEAYRNRGYMDVIVDATPKLDTSSHQVAFTISATPGPQYHLRNLTTLNLNAAQKKDFDSTWKLRKGDIYDAGYVSSYLKNDATRHPLTNYSASFKLIEDPEEKALDLIINFTKAAATAINPPATANTP